MASPNETPRPPREVPVEVIASAEPEKKKKTATFFHPVSGLAILLIDWMTFGLDLPSGFLLVAFSSAVAFALTFGAVYWIQVRESGDAPKRAAWKAFIGGVAAGVPFPITGTAVGAAILVLSGLPLLRNR